MKPAFPTRNSAVISGMSLRDYFAAKALQPLLAKDMWFVNEGETSEQSYAKAAYAIADAMLAESQNLTKTQREA